MRFGAHGYSQFGVASFLVRLSGALFVVLSTYNPSGLSYSQWVMQRWDSDWPLQLPLIPLYAIAYLLLLRATWRGLGPAGMLLMAALLGALAWLLLDLGVIRITDAGDIGLLGLYLVAALLGIGVSWMWIWTRITGQVYYDDLTQ